jgi:hypothetical protein
MLSEVFKFIKRKLPFRSEVFTHASRKIDSLIEQQPKPEPLAHDSIKSRSIRKYGEKQQPIVFAFQGSGNKAEDKSLTAEFAQKFENHVIIDGAGTGPFTDHEFLGLRQDRAQFRRRIYEANQSLSEYHGKGGKGDIIIVAHSRGSSAAYAFTEILDKQGLIDMNTHEQLLPPGVPIKASIYFDPVPSTPARGLTLLPEPKTDLPGDYSLKEVSYNQMPLQKNVKKHINFIAGAEQRDQFSNADVGLSGDKVINYFIEHARHSDVDGYPGNNTNIALLVKNELAWQLPVKQLKDWHLDYQKQLQLHYGIQRDGVREEISSESLLRFVTGETKRIPPRDSLSESQMLKSAKERITFKAFQPGNSLLQRRYPSSLVDSRLIFPEIEKSIESASALDPLLEHLPPLSP